MLGGRLSSLLPYSNSLAIRVVPVKISSGTDTSWLWPKSSSFKDTRPCISLHACQLCGKGSKIIYLGKDWIRFCRARRSSSRVKLPIEGGREVISLKETLSRTRLDRFPDITTLLSMYVLWINSPNSEGSEDSLFLDKFNTFRHLQCVTKLSGIFVSRFEDTLQTRMRGKPDFDI